MGDALHLDFETRSAADLKKVGAHRYAQDPTTTILCTSYRFGETGPVKSWLGVEPPAEVFEHVANGGRIVGHNQGFERVIWNALIGSGNAAMDPSQQDCTLSRALAMGLPAGLDNLGAALKLTFQKDRDGHNLMLKMCKDGYVPKPGELERLSRYCDRDVETETDADRHLPPLSARERRVWELDQRINDRGFAVDLRLVQRAELAVLEAKRRADAAMWRLTNGAIKKASQARALADWINAAGIPCTSIADGEIDELVVGADLVDRPDVAGALALRRASAGAFKFEAMLRAVCADGRIRGSLQYHGTHGGRWSGRVVQPQNFKRMDTDEEVAATGEALEILREYEKPDQALDAMELLLDLPALEVLSLCARPMIVAKPGHVLYDADFSNIEGRLNAWFAGEDWKLDAFRAYDAGVGPDLYRVTASKVLGKSVADVSKAERQNQGKVPELACIAEGELVLTDQGLVPIEKVNLSMLVWDGVDFVSHEGTVYRGIKEVITYDGLTATRDHRVWIDGQNRPVRFEHAAASGQRLVQSGAGRHPVRVGEDHLTRASLSTQMVGAIRGRRVPGLSQNRVGVPVQPDQRQEQRVPEMHLCSVASRARAQMVGAQVHGRQAAMYQSESQSVQRLWRPRHHVRVPVIHGHGVVGTRAPRSEERFGTGSHRQRSRLPTRQSSVVDQARQHEELSCVKTAKTYDIRNAGPRNRFTASGRLVHNCGYQGGVVAFQKMGAKYGVSISDAHARKIVADWREANPRITDSWAELGQAAIDAVQHPGLIVPVLNNKVQYTCNGDFLWCRLPSGRIISYAAPTVGWKTKVLTIDDEVVELESFGLSYWGSKNGRWLKLDLYGGAQCAHIVSGTARDLLVEAMFAVEAAGYPLILTIHDELLCETPEGFGSVQEFENIIANSKPDWARGLPLVSKAWKDVRYAK